MAEYDNTNSGALFKNEDKDEAHPNWADYQGSIDVEGTEYWISAWLRTGKKSGKKFMSLTVKTKEANKAPQQSQISPPVDDLSDDIPF